MLLLFILRQGGIKLGGVLGQMSSANPWLVVLAMLGFPCLIFLKSARWYLLIKESGYNYPLTSCFRSYFAGFAVGVITPGRLGELAKAAYLKAELGAGLGASLRTVIGDRIYDLLFLCCFGSVGYVHLFYEMPRFAWLPLFLLTYLCALAGVFAFIKVSGRIRLGGGKLEKLKDLAGQVAEDFQGRTAVLNWLLTIVAYTVYFGMCFVLLKALGIHVAFMTVCFTIACMSLILLIPISIAGFGPREATLVYLLGRYGVAPEAALSFSLLQFAVFFLFGGVLGTVALFFSPLPIGEIRRGGAGE